MPRMRDGNDFNPHSPCGERRGESVDHFVVGLISIHTPLAGSDTSGNGLTFYGDQFQSTLPLRGATDVAVRAETVERISIHTPLAGSDTTQLGCVQRCMVISIHTPLAGSDSARPVSPQLGRISIHTPLAGSDLTPTSD